MSTKTVEQLEQYFYEFWENESDFIVMPNTNRARTYLERIRGDISIERILDNDENMDGLTFAGIPINYAMDFLSENTRNKILVSAHYVEISEQLKSLGYQENVDYMDMHAFISIWYWRKKQELHMLDVHTAITTYCSLNCKDCNMFMSYYPKENRKHISLEEFKQNFNALFKSVDYCYRITILGGEPLMNRQLPQMLLWLHEVHGERIGKVYVTTNGTIIPYKELIEAVKKTNTICNVSDYSENVWYKGKLNDTIDVLQKNQIIYELNKELNWRDFFFPEREQQVQFSTERAHMLCCNPAFRGLNDMRFYYCHIVWSAVQTGLWMDKEGDYVMLNEFHDEKKKRQLLEHDLGFVSKGYISLCRVCGGCGVDNTHFIETGIQRRTNE